MSSSSGGTNRAGQISSTNKIKTIHSNAPTPGFQLVGKNGKPLNNSTNPVSPNFQQIINNHPLLNMSNTAFEYNVIPTHTQPINTTSPMSPNIMTPITAALMSTISVRLRLGRFGTASYNKMHTINSLQQSFPLDYIGPVIILVESSDPNTNLGNWHPISAAKFFTNNFTGIINIKPAGRKKIKITFDIITNGNLCLSSSILNDNNYKSIIPSTLIFSYGIIKLDISVSEEEFLESVQLPLCIQTYQRKKRKQHSSNPPC